MTRRTAALLGLLGAAVVLLVWRWGDVAELARPQMGQKPPPRQIPEPAPPEALVEGLALTLVEVARGYRAPVDVVTAPVGSVGAPGAAEALTIVVDQPGVVFRMPSGRGDEGSSGRDVGGPGEVFVDLTEEVAWGGERGLLGLAFAPDYGESRAVYVYYTAAQSEVAGKGANTLARLTAAEDGLSADRDTLELLLEVPDPAGNHNGGQVRFGPDGMLYVALGDGGGGGDPWKTSQDPTSLLGKILRLDVGHAPKNPARQGVRKTPHLGLHQGVRKTPSPTRFQRIIHGLERATGRARRSSSGGCGTPGASTLTLPMATFGWAMWVRTRGRKSTTYGPGRRPGRTLGGAIGRGWRVFLGRRRSVPARMRLGRRLSRRWWFTVGTRAAR